MPDEADRRRLWHAQPRRRDAAPGRRHRPRASSPPRSSCPAATSATSVLGAAFFAAEQNQPIAMADLIKATAREYRKLGHLCAEAEFGAYFAADQLTPRLIPAANPTALSGTATCTAGHRRVLAKGGDHCHARPMRTYDEDGVATAGSTGSTERSAVGTTVQRIAADRDARAARRQRRAGVATRRRQRQRREPGRR